MTFTSLTGTFDESIFGCGSFGDGELVQVLMPARVDDDSRFDVVVVGVECDCASN